MRMIQIACTTGALVLLSLTAASAQNLPQSGPTLEVHLRTLKHTGGVGMTARSDEMLVPGTRLNWFLMAGSSNPTELTVCGGGVAGSGTLADKMSRNAFVWDIRAVPSKFENGTATFDLEWARYQADGSGRPAAEGRTTLTLREGDQQQIDFVRGVPGSRNCTDDAAVVEVSAGYRENSQLAQSILQYDLWLKDEQPNGQTITRKFTAMGAQGGDVAFLFAPLAFAVQLPPEQGAYDVMTSVQGTVKGRVLANGRIALLVDTSRRDGLAAKGTSTAGGSGNSGRKLLEVSSDEPIEIELPAPGGSSRRGTVTVNNAEFFQGHRTSLIVQVKQLR